jgi:3-hydroxyisobutyrate dehydrogenase-like beta-hydroxyacid dehydrogenase
LTTEPAEPAEPARPAAPADTAPSLVGLCGLGNMGSALASRLRLEFEVLGFDLDPAKRAASPRVRACEHLADLAAAPAVVLCLPSPDASLAVVTELAPLMRPGSVIIETSTVNPEHVRAQHAAAAPHGIGLVDAAIAAGVGQARAGTALLLTGGSQADVETARPVLAAMSRRFIHLGELGQGAALKVINNAIAHAVMVVLVEAAALAEAAGVDRSQLISLLQGDDAGLTRPLEHRLIERIARGDYEGGMPTEAARKDSTLALALAQSCRVPSFALQATHTVYELATAEGYGRLDYAAIAKLWEQWLGTSLATKPQDTA